MVWYFRTPSTTKLSLEYLSGTVTVLLLIVKVSIVWLVESTTFTVPTKLELSGIVILITPVILFKFAVTPCILLVTVPVNLLVSGVSAGGVGGVGWVGVSVGTSSV